MPNTFIPFDGWRPGGGYFGEGWNEATNLFPAFESWRPWRSFDAAASSKADGPMTGGHVHVWSAGLGGGTYAPDAQTIFGGSPTHLYSVDATTGAFTDVSRAALYTATGGGWRFASVGNDIWATNWLDPLQRRTNNAGLFANGVVSTFKPQPRFIATVREHMVAANLSNAGRFQDEVVWSDADDTTNYDPATGTSTSLAGNKRLVSVPGQITGLVGGQYALVFKRSCIFYLEYTGTTQVFRPDFLSESVGTALPSSIIKSRYGVFFLGADGFYRIEGLSAPRKISPPGIDQFLLDSAFSNLSIAGSLTAWQEDTQLEGFQVPSWPLVGWAFRGLWGDPSNDVGLLYNPVTDAWSQVDLGNGNQFPTVMLSRPYAETLYDSLVMLSWDETTSRLARWSSSPASTKGATIRLRYRPANFDTATRQGQSLVSGVLPIFSKTSVDGTPLSTSVSVSAMLDPYVGEYGTPETRVAADRDLISGAYPFQKAGRLFLISIFCSEGEDFESFAGVWVDQRLLT